MTLADWARPATTRNAGECRREIFITARNVVFERKKTVKRKITLSIALTLSIILVLLTTSDSPVAAQPPQRFVFDTGLVKVGVGQTFILFVAAGDFNGDGRVDGTDFVFRRFAYVQGPCSADGACRQTIESQFTSNRMMLMPDEAASIVVDPSDPSGNTVRAVVMSSNRNARVTATIIDKVTGKTTSHIIVANTEGDIH